jgi:hypothetical protein
MARFDLLPYLLIKSLNYEPLSIGDFLICPFQIVVDGLDFVSLAACMASKILLLAHNTSSAVRARPGQPVNEGLTVKGRPFFLPLRERLFQKSPGRYRSVGWGFSKGEPSKSRPCTRMWGFLLPNIFRVMVGIIKTHNDAMLA